MARWLRAWLAFAMLLGWPCGCHWTGHHFGRHGQPPAPLQNPMFVPAMDREFLWNQVVDTVDDYFQIQNEQRIHVVGDVLVEGRIDTLPTDGSTILEPWRKDSTHGFEKLHATLQSVRRTALVRVTPTGSGFLIDVQVFKELEDRDRPEFASVGQRSLSDVQQQEDRENAGLEVNPLRDEQGRFTMGWIPQGRDVSLEQKMLYQLQGRLGL